MRGDEREHRGTCVAINAGPIPLICPQLIQAPIFVGVDLRRGERAHGRGAWSDHILLALSAPRVAISTRGASQPGTSTYTRGTSTYTRVPSPTAFCARTSTR
jgi:hypothetical protein